MWFLKTFPRASACTFILFCEEQKPYLHWASGCNNPINRSFREGIKCPIRPSHEIWFEKVAGGTKVQEFILLVAFTKDKTITIQDRKYFFFLIFNLGARLLGNGSKGWREYPCPTDNPKEEQGRRTALKTPGLWNLGLPDTVILSWISLCHGPL